jgi:ribosome-associated protein
MTDWAAEAKAEDIILLDVRKATYLADYFVICTATSERQLTSLTDRIRDQASAAGVEPANLEGTPDSGWILIDYGDFVIHLFTPEARAYYSLEEVWGDAPHLDWRAGGVPIAEPSVFLRPASPSTD